MRQHYVITEEQKIPLIGVNAFGIIDRGTNIIQVRPISGCPLNCIYCSVDEGPYSKKINTYEVEADYLLSEFNKTAEYKDSNDLEAHIDGAGEPLLYKHMISLVKGLRNNQRVKTISMQTNGVLLDKELIKSLAKAGMNRVNLSINTFNYELAKAMTGTDWYDINQIKMRAEQIIDAGMQLLIAPVLVPGYNEDSMSELIVFAKKLKAMIGIQKYEHHKRGRRLRIKEQTWYEFNKLMKRLENKHDYKLLFSRKDFNIHKTKSLLKPFKKGDAVRAKVVLPGWLKNEVIIAAKNRLITVFNSDNKISDLVKARILKTKHNIYLAEKI